MSLQKEHQNRKMTKRSIDSYKKELTIHDACEEGNLEAVKTLIESSPSEIWKTDEICYFSGLHVAANHGHIAVVKFLLDAGADINRKSKSGETPLHLAVLRNHPDIVKCLLVRGADYTITNFHKKAGYTVRHTPREVAVEEHLPEIVKIFDQMKVFEKKKEKETELQVVFLANLAEKQKKFDDAMVSSLKSFTSKGGGSGLQEFVEAQEKEKLEFQEKRQEEISSFYKTNKTLRIPPELLPPVVETTEEKKEVVTSEAK